MTPTVSIVLPNLNTDLTFLKERVDSIVMQSFADWECIVIDGFSINGSWEFFQEIKKCDLRFTCYQYPKEGIYKAWNSGIALAKGKYVYIAPSDDTMSLTLLERMVDGLEQYPNCSVAHCNLTVIDEYGNKSNKKNWDRFVFATFDNLSNKLHMRMAPYDGVVYCGVGVVYTSITQLLIKKKVFETIGYFLTDQGASADVEWGMRVGFVFNILHIPEYLATWRIHNSQATDDSQLGSYALNTRFANYVSYALTLVMQKKLLMVNFTIKELQYNYKYSALLAQLRKSASVFVKMKVFFFFFLRYPFRSIQEVGYRIFHVQRPSNFMLTRKIIKRYQLANHIVLM